MARGKERQIICASCKRFCRRDKAVYIEKVVFSNPVERKDVAEPEEYHAVFKREVAYCPGCGKHLRIYEKKKQQNQARKEREMARPMNSRFGDGMRTRKGGYKDTPSQPNVAQTAAPKPAEQQPETETQTDAPAETQ